MPYAFTEQGIYMLMTVLKGDLAIKQSKALIRTFKRMKDYIIENQGLIGEREYLQMSMQVTQNVLDTLEIRHTLDFRLFLENQEGYITIDILSLIMERRHAGCFIAEPHQKTLVQELLV